jgi:thiol-disulfide isomerase/thioredoxin
MTLVYFTGKWCPPCKEFTPLLRKFYLAANGGGGEAKTLEIVVVPCVKDEGVVEEVEGLELLRDKNIPCTTVTGSSQAGGHSFYDQAKAYYGTWAGPRDGRKFGGAGHNGIPTLVLVDSKGEPVTFMARRDVVKAVNTGKVEEVLTYWRTGLEGKKVWDKEMEEKGTVMKNIWVSSAQRG